MIMGVSAKMMNVPVFKLMKNIDIYKYKVSHMNFMLELIRVIKGKEKHLTKEMYDNSLATVYGDITISEEYETDMMELFIPMDDKDGFIVNKESGYYEKIANKLTMEQFIEKMDPTNEVVIQLKANPNMWEEILDDVYILWALTLFFDKIEESRVLCYAILGALIEHVVKNITLSDWKTFIARKVDPYKVSKYGKDLFFTPEIARLKAFYLSDSSGMDKFDTFELLSRLTSGINTKNDAYAVLAIYEILAYAIPDIVGGDKVETSPCRDYVRDVISKIL